MRRKALAAMLVCGVGLALYLASGIVFSAAAGTPDTAAANEDLVKEIQALRKDIGLLRADIQELRTQLADIKRQVARTGRGGVERPEPRQSQSGGAKIEFTLVPGRGAGSESRGNIAGTAFGVSEPEKYKVVLYALTDYWYVQPLTAEPFTAIKSDGTWNNWTQLGYRYAALLVRPSFKPEPKTHALPAVGGDVVAVTEVPAN